MLKGGVIMDVIDADQARIAEEAGAVAVMALERFALPHPPLVSLFTTINQFRSIFSFIFFFLIFSRRKRK
jgi:hypothetical protein